MQVKKFEAPTIQEALDHVKRELGPEAIILQTKQNKRGFGLMSKGSVEITAAVSDRSLTKKQSLENRLPEPAKMAVKKMSAERQADVFNKYMDKQVERAQRTQERVEVSSPKERKITATRYIDIEDSGDKAPAQAAAQQRKPAPKPMQQQAQMPSRAEPTPVSPAQAVVASGLPSSLEEEVKLLRKMVAEMKAQTPTPEQSFVPATRAEFQRSSPVVSAANDGAWVAQSGLEKTLLQNPVLQEAFDQLVVNGVDRRYVLGLLKKVAFDLGSEHGVSADLIQDLLAGEIMDSVEVGSILTEVQTHRMPGPDGTSMPAMIAFVGPTGVGKTTTIAKLASELLQKKNIKVGLVNSDANKVNAFDQLGTYAKILNVPFRCATSVEDLQVAVSDFKNLDLIMIDTSGLSQKQTEMVKKTETIFKGLPNLKSYLVLSSTTRDTELFETTKRFLILNPRGIIFTKLDEASIFGAIYNLYQRVKLPLLYFTTGQKIPDDIEGATPERLAALLMDI